LSHESVILDISPFLNASFFLFFNDTKSIFHHDRHFAQMTGNQLSCCSSNQLSFTPSLLEHMGLHPLQDYKERRCQDQQKNMEELVHFLQEYT
jgi:hypothetical protein